MSPLWPLFPVTLLTLLALLATSLTEPQGVPPGGACACGRDQPRPKIAAATASGRRSELYSSKSYLSLWYSDDITIFCSSNDASNLTIRDVDHQLQAERLNSTTILVTLIKPDAGEYNYHCTDSITACTDTLHVEVACGHLDPTIAATTTAGERSERDTSYSYLLSSYGDDITIFCSSNDASNLTILDDDDHQLQAERLNSTTIQVTLIKPDEREYNYYCTDSNTACTDTLHVEVACGYLGPTIAATTTAGERSERDTSYSYLLSSYGDDITIYCSSNDTSNTIRDVDHQLQAERLNSTTIQVTLIKPDVGEYNYHCTDSNTACTDTLHVEVACGHLDPTIAATTTGERSKRDTRYSYLFSSYGDDITIFCSSNDTSNLTIRDGDHQLQAERLNSTTIQVTLIKPDVGEYNYHCADSISACTDPLRVYVHPVMYVTAPHVYQRRDKYGLANYFVPRGETYNAYCSGQPTSHLTISYDGHDIETKSLNATTLMATMLDHTEGEREYFCTSSSSQVVKGVQITVDYNPEARDFFCVMYIFIKLECWWKSTTSQNIFNLLLIYDQRSTLVCHDRSHALTAGCASVLDDDWRSYITDDYSISVQLESCNKIFCRNQTFHIDLLSIAKLDPVDDLKMRSTSSLGATVAWHQYKDLSMGYFTYKVEYRLLGRDWRPVNASTEHCGYSGTCELQLALPCPDAHYELRVYIRFERATLDMYWSEPATVFFFTAPSTGGEVHPACGVEFREPEPPLSATAVLHEVRELISDDRKEERALKEYINGLKKKVAQIKTLMDAQKQRNP